MEMRGVCETPEVEGYDTAGDMTAGDDTAGDVTAGEYTAGEDREASLSAASRSCSPWPASKNDSPGGIFLSPSRSPAKKIETEASRSSRLLPGQSPWRGQPRGRPMHTQPKLGGRTVGDPAAGRPGARGRGRPDAVGRQGLAMAPIRLQAFVPARGRERQSQQSAPRGRPRRARPAPAHQQPNVRSRSRPRHLISHADVVTSEPCEDNCYAYCLAESLNIKALQQKWQRRRALAVAARAKAIAAAASGGRIGSTLGDIPEMQEDRGEMQVIPLYKERGKDQVALIKIGRKDCFVFNFGCLVCWGCTAEEAQAARNAVDEVLEKHLDPKHAEEDSIPIGSNNSPVAHREATTMERIAVAYALAQSVRLGSLELLIDRAIAKTRSIPEELAHHGHVNLNKSQVAKMIGEICVLRNQVNLHTDILDLPDFFWQWEEFEPLYVTCRHYLDMEKRVSILNSRLEVLQDMFDVLENDQDHHHENRLEWVVIVLCAVEAFVMGLRLYTRIGRAVHSESDEVDQRVAILPILGPLSWSLGVLKQFLGT